MSDRGHSEPETSPEPRSLLVFLSYRRKDGSWHAEWLNECLADVVFEGSDGEPCRLRLYYDKEAPGVADWKELHFPSLQSSHAMLLICTPGMAKDLSERGKPDWVYEEIRWWMRRRRTAPIVIDATGEGDRWLPERVRRKWPNINRIDLDRREAERAEAAGDTDFSDRIRERVLATIRQSERATTFEDLERSRRLTRRLTWALSLAVLLLLATAYAGYEAYRYSQEAERNSQEAERNSQEAERNSQEAERNSQEAEHQRVIAQSRQIASQAELLRIQQPGLLHQSVLLAVESMRRFPTLEGRRAIQNGLGLMPIAAGHWSSPDLVERIEFGAQGRLISAGWGGRTSSWDVSTGEIRFGTQRSMVTLLATTPEGALVASGGCMPMSSEPDCRTVRLWDRQWHELARLEHEARVLALAFSPNGRLLAAGAAHIDVLEAEPGKGGLWIWDTETYEEVSRLARDHNITALTFSPDGRWLAGVVDPHEVRVWDLEDWAVVASLEHGGTMVNVMDFSPDGRQLAAGIGSVFGDAGEVWVWDVAGGTRLFRDGLESGVGAVRFTRDGRRLIAGSGNGDARVWDLARGEEDFRLPHEYGVHQIRLGVDGSLVATASGDGNTRGAVHAWCLRDGKEVARIPYDDDVQSIAFSPDGAFLASVGGSDVHIWKPPWARAGIEGWTLDPADASSAPKGRFATVSPDLGRLVTVEGDVGKENIIRVRVIDTGEEIARLTHDGFVSSASWHPREPRLALGTFDVGVKIIDVGSGTQIGRVDVRSDDETRLVWSVAFSPDGRKLAVGDDSGVQVSDIETNRVLWYGPNQGPTHAVAFSPDGTRLATGHGSEERWIRLWDVESGEILAEASQPADVEALAFSEDGALLASGGGYMLGRYGRAAVWDLQLRQLAEMVHESDVRAVTFSPNGKSLGTASDDGTVRVWRVSDGEELARVTLEGASVVRLDDDGEWLWSGSRFGSSHQWPWGDDELLEAACSRLPRNLTGTEWEKFFGDEPGRPTCPELPDATKVQAPAPDAIFRFNRSHGE